MQWLGSCAPDLLRLSHGKCFAVQSGAINKGMLVHKQKALTQLLDMFAKQENIIIALKEGVLEREQFSCLARNAFVSAMTCAAFLFLKLFLIFRYDGRSPVRQQGLR